jgi:glycosyltransferase involved in cell wall biosynthesis
MPNGAPTPALTRPAALRALAGRRLVFVLTTLELGGAERQALRLADELRRRCEARVEFIAFSQPGRVARACEARDIPWRLEPLPSLCERPAQHLWRSARTLRRFARALRRSRPEILLPYTLLPNVCCGLVWRRTGARLCVWNQRCAGRHRTHRWAELEAVARTPLFFSNSTPGVEFLTGELSAPRERVFTVPNAVALPPPNEDRAACRARLKLAPDAPAACMLAALSDAKDHATLLRAWRLVLDAAPAGAAKPALLLAGRRLAPHQRLRELAARLRLEDHVRFLDHVEDVSGLLRACDFAVFSSQSEGSPNGLLESMAAGLAAAATDIPGIREALGAEQHPFLAPPGDAEALADRVLRLIRDRELRARLGQANRGRIMERHDPERVFMQVAELLARFAFAEDAGA